MCHHSTERAGLTLVEMLVAMAVLGILALGLGSMAATVHQTNDFVRRQNEALQHARIACQRIEDACRQATATAEYPGFWPVSTEIGGYSFPDALVVWRPNGGAPANDDGPPLYRELIVYTFDPAVPNELIEMTVRGAAGTAPLPTDNAAWGSAIDAMHASNGVEKVRLTDLLRIGNAGDDESNWRGAIRFHTRYHPTMAQWNGFQTGAIGVDDMTWPLGLHDSRSGVRQSWCAIELQVVPRGEARRGAEAEENALGFFGSAELLYALED